MRIIIQGLQITYAGMEGNTVYLDGIVVGTICHNISVVFDFVALISCDHFFF